MRARLSCVLAAVSALALGLALSGCGGSGGGAESGGKRGSLRMTIQWPKDPTERNIPKLAKRLHLTIGAPGNATPLVEQDVDKPANGETQSVVSFKDLPTDTNLVLKCQAKGGQSNSDDTLLGIASESVSIRPGVPAVVVLNLVSTISKLEVQLNGAVAGDVVHMFRNESATVDVTAKDADGAIVPIAPGSLNIETNGSAITLITESITLLSALDQLGTGELVVSEEESGKSTHIQVSVDKRPGVQSIEITPSGPLTLINGQTLTLAAKAYDEDHVEVPGATINFSLESANGVSLLGNVLKGDAGNGTATLVATEPTSGVRETASVFVQEHGPAVRFAVLDPNSLEVPAEGLTLAPGTNYQLSAASFDQFDNRAQPPTGVTWSVSDTSGIFTVTSSGLLKVSSSALFGSTILTVKGTIQTATGPQQMTKTIPVGIAFGG